MKGPALACVVLCLGVSPVRMFSELLISFQYAPGGADMHRGRKAKVNYNSSDF